LDNVIISIFTPPTPPPRNTYPSGTGFRGRSLGPGNPPGALLLQDLWPATLAVIWDLQNNASGTIVLPMKRQRGKIPVRLILFIN